MRLWEYAVEVVPADPEGKHLRQALDARGSGGWELVAVTPCAVGHPLAPGGAVPGQQLVFKRPAPLAEDQVRIVSPAGR